jgi:hypothetical protein
MDRLLYLSRYRYCRIRNRKEGCGGGDRIKDTCIYFITTYLTLSLTAAISMAESDAFVGTNESDCSLSESLGTKTLQARPIVPDSFRDNPITW